jgi:hypothetical protein
MRSPFRRKDFKVGDVGTHNIKDIAKHKGISIEQALEETKGIQKVLAEHPEWGFRITIYTLNGETLTDFERIS